MLIAARPEVDNLDARFVGLLEKDILRLQVAVNDLSLPQKLQGNENLDREATNRFHIESVVAIPLDELVQIFA